MEATPRRDNAILNLEVLRILDLGNSVAEFDASLEAYFVETETFRRLARGEVDIVAGDKGTGKTALFRILSKRYGQMPELDQVEVVAAFNPTGSPVFQRLTEGEALTEGEYSTLWKAYIVGLAGNWILTLYEDAYTDRMFELEALLEKTGLRTKDDDPSTVFSAIVNLFRRLMNPNSVGATATITPQGLPVITATAELGDGSHETPAPVPHEEALALLDTVLAEVDLSLWLVLDRLDEAFAGTPDAEVPALRALLRTYLDLVPYERVRLKLFVRKDLFRRIIGEGFVNLTHVNARKVEITWDDESLLDLLLRRIRENREFVNTVSPDDEANDLFDALFPEQVDPGDRKPKTWTWMMGRIRDANDVRPPRNLIDLVQKSQAAALRREERERVAFSRGAPLIHADSLKRGLEALSATRVEDTLLAESGSRAALVERFRNGKAEHNMESLAEVLGSSGDELAADIQFLREIGFLEPVGANFKIPMLYRDGLSITQGKAFIADDTGDDD